MLFLKRQSIRWFAPFVMAVAAAACTTVPEPEPLHGGLTKAQVEALSNEGFTKIEDGMMLVMSSRILFELNSSDVAVPAQESIAKVTQTLQQVEVDHVRLDGHTDNIGANAYNVALSERRARAVADVMVATGYADEQIAIRALGASKPIADNSTEEGRASNRRVSMVVGNASHQ